MRILAMFLIWVLVALGQYVINVEKKVDLVNTQTTNIKKEHKDKQRESMSKFEDLWKKIVEQHMDSVNSIIESNKKEVESMLVIVKDYTVAYRELNAMLISSKSNQSFMDSNNYKTLVRKLYKTTITLTVWDNKEILEYDWLPPWFDCVKYSMDFCFSETYNNKIVLPDKYDLVVKEIQLPSDKKIDYYINNINSWYDFKKLIP